MKLLLSCLLFVFSFACAMENKYKIPDEQTLNERLFEIGFDHFAAKTGFVYKIANIEVYPFGISVLIDSGFMKYRDNLKEGGMPEVMINQLMELKLASKSKLYEAIFQDHPRALIELNDLNKEKK